MPARSDPWSPSLARVGAMVLLTVVLVLVRPAVAHAHALLVASEPANGAVVADGPKRAQLTFSEEFSPELSTAWLVDSGGRTVPGTKIGLGSDSQTLVVVLPSLSPGTYGVLWRVLAEDDGHSTDGTVIFSVGVVDARTAIAAPGGAGSTTPWDLVRRWLGIAALAGLIGMLAVAGFVLARASRREDVGATIRAASRRLRAVASGCAMVAAATGVADLTAEARHARPSGATAGAAVEIVTSTRWGHAWAVREVALVALIVLLVRIRATGRAFGASLALLLALTVSAEAFMSHAAAVHGARPAALVSDAVHIAAACIWLGALPALAIVVSARPTSTARRADVVRAVGGRFSALVIVSVAAVLVTGLYNAAREIATVHGLVSGSYGRSLLVKIAILVVLAAVGGMNAARLHPATGRSPRLSRRLVLVETGVGAILLLAVAVLVESPPPLNATTVAVSQEPLTYSGTSGDLVLRVAVSPGQPGLNAVTVDVASTQRPAPAAVTAVAVRMTKPGDGAIKLRRIADGSYYATVRLPSVDDLRVSVDVARGPTRRTVLAPWVSAAASSEPASGRAVALWPFLAAAFGLLVAGGAGVAWAWTLRRRRPVEKIELRQGELQRQQ